MMASVASVCGRARAAARRGTTGVPRPKAKEPAVIFIVVKWTIRPERSGEFLDLVADFTSGTRSEPGNLFFDWSRSVDNPHQFVLVEGFRDGAGEAHVTSDHFKAAMSWMPDVIAEKPEIINVEVPGEGFGRMAELTPSGA
jgi:quinol monooxygenase YgiN